MQVMLWTEIFLYHHKEGCAISSFMKYSLSRLYRKATQTIEYDSGIKNISLIKAIGGNIMTNYKFWDSFVWGLTKISCKILRKIWLIGYYSEINYTK